MPKRSLVWDYFLNISDNKRVECSQCKKEVPNNGNTTNLMRHLKNHHPIQHSQLLKVTCKKYQSEDEAGEESSTSEYAFLFQNQEDIDIDKKYDIARTSSQIPIRETFKPTNELAQEKITSAIAYHISIDMQPYNLIEKEGFKQLLHICSPSFQIPTQQTIIEHYIPKLYDSTKQIIANLIADVPYLSLTTDCWTSLAKETFISLTAHFIGSDWNLDSACLNCSTLSENYTGETIYDFLLESNIPQSKIIAITTDNGENILSAIEELGVKHVSCFGDVLNTAVSKVLEIENLQLPLSKLKKIQNIARDSWKFNIDLSNIQISLDIEQRSSLTDVKTYWWSLLKLMKIGVEQHLNLIEILTAFNNGQYKSLILSEYEIDSIKSAIELLKPFEDISENLSCESNITASAIIPILNKIFSHLSSYNETEGIQRVIVDILCSIFQESYSDQVKDLLKKCTFFDSRFKASYFDEEEKNQVIDAIFNDTVIMCKVKNENTIYFNTLVENVDIPNKRMKVSGLAAIFGLSKKSTNPQLSKEEIIKEEINAYVRLSLLPIHENSLRWWKENHKTFPHLSLQAIKYLCIQATRIPSDRVFSGSSTITDRRASLTGQNVQQVIYLASNHKYAPKP